MIKVLKIDEEGYFIEDVILEDDHPTPIGCIDVLCPGGFYKPKWNGSEWVEGLTQLEIDEIKNTIPPKTEVELLQDEILKLKVAIAEMYEGGV